MMNKILVVEDDEVNLMIAEHVLTKEGLHVKTVNNGEEAIEIVKVEPFDMILMDIEMPIMDGLEATPLIRQLENGKSIPIIALTAHHMPEKIQEFREAGMDDYIIKPIDPVKFNAILDRYFKAGTS